jgi:phage protein D
MSTPTPEAALLPNDAVIPWRAPRLRLLANGTQITGVIDAEVRSNNHYGADRFSAAVALGTDPSAPAGFWASQTDIQVDVQFSLDGGASFQSLIVGAVDSVAIDPIIGHIQIHGRDLTAGLIEARTQETFANRTASEIATILASRHQLVPVITQTTTPVGRYYQSEHDRITLGQFSRATTEWDLLVFLARQEGFDVFVQGQELHFQPASDAPALAQVIRPTDVTELRLERALTIARDIEVTVKSWNSRTQSAFTQTARAARQQGAGQGGGKSGPPQRYVFVLPNLTPDAALKFAQRKLQELTQHERVIEVSMPGELSLSPRSMLILDGTGTEFDQAYFVDTVERRLHYENGFTQHIRAKNTSPRSQTTVPADIVATVTG